MQIRMAVAAVAILLTGCVVTPNVYDSDPNEFTSVPPTHGVVLFQAVTLDPRLNQYMAGWHTMRASRIGGGEMTWLKEGEKVPLKYHVYPDYSVLPGTTLWVGVLPEGNYIAEDLYSSFNNGNYYGHLAVPIADRYASFRIEPGRLTVLDAYLYKALAENHMLANVESPHDLIKMARDAYPDIMSAVEAKEPLRFATRDPEEQDETLNTMASLARTVGQAEYGPDGRIYRAARTGQLFERTPEGDWRRHSFDTFEPIQSIAAQQGGEATVLTMSGRAFHRASANDAFEELDVDLDAHLQSLDRLPDGRWLAAVRTEKLVSDNSPGRRRGATKEAYTLNLLTASAADSTEWTPLASMPVETAYADARLDGWKAYIGNPTGKGSIIDVRNGETTPLPAGFAYLRFYGDGTVLGYTAPVSSAFWGRQPADLWLSEDSGAHWIELPDIEPMGMPEKTADGQLRVVARGAGRSRKEILAGKERFTGVLGARADSREWSEIEMVPDGCSGWIEIRQLEDGLVMLCEYETFYRERHRSEWIDENMRGTGKDEDAGQE